MIARQPICDTALKVVAYEILYRANCTTHAIIDDPDNATIDVLLSAFNDRSITDVVQDKFAFVNFTSNVILHNMPPINSKQLVVELLEDQEITDELLKKIRRLRQQGIKIALDDFCLNSETISLIDYADIIKLDVLAESLDTWENYIPMLKAKGITLLAEKVETYDVFERCKKMGFTLFQGYFFAKPNLVEGKKLSRNQLSVINLLNKISDPKIEISDLTEIIAHDPSMSYSLLRSINSGLFRFPNKMNSITQAVTLLGLNNLRSWLNFLALSSLDNKPQLLNDTAITRSKLCEWLGIKITKKREASEYFTAGLLSVVDAFFDVKMEELINKLSLNNDLELALLNHKGTIGKTLRCVVDYEKGIWHEQHDKFLEFYNIVKSDFINQYLNIVDRVENKTLNRPA